MYIDYIKHWIPISKEEYEENCPEITENDDVLEVLKKLCKSLKFYKKCIYKEPGLNNIINDDIIGYQYYKLGKEEPVYVCSKEEYNKLQK